VKNIRDFFKEGRKVVVKVMRIDRGKRQIDLSLKRTTEQQKKYKLQQWKQRQKAEKLLEMAARKLKKGHEEAFAEVAGPLLSTHPDLYTAFEEVVREGKEVLTKEKLPKAWIDVLHPLIASNISLPSVRIEGFLRLQCFEPDGVSVVKEALAEMAKPVDGGGEKLTVQVIGPPRYRVTLEAENYKIAENTLQEHVKNLEGYLSGHDYSFEFSRGEK
jgi:translation initiation factor 2 subunit 1